MLSGKRMRAPGAAGGIARYLVIALTLAAAGCSAEVTRFDFNNKQTTGSIPPIPDQPVGNGYGAGRPPRGLGLTEAPLPPSDPPPANYGLAGNNYGSNYASATGRPAAANEYQRQLPRRRPHL